MTNSRQTAASTNVRGTDFPSSAATTTTTGDDGALYNSWTARNKDQPATFERGFRFWAIIVNLCVTGLISALENIIVTILLPLIVNELNIGDNYIWITNGFFLAR